MIDAKTAAMFISFIFVPQKSIGMITNQQFFLSFVFLFFRLKNPEKSLQVDQVPFILYYTPYHIIHFIIGIRYIFHLKNPEE